jgi:lysophospholipase L1-like esterase
MARVTENDESNSGLESSGEGPSGEHEDVSGSPSGVTGDAVPDQSRAISIKKRLGFALVALVVFFVVTELILFGVSRVVAHQMVGRFNPDRQAKTEEVFRVATFGDSVTAGQGTAPQYSYPRQLEELLNQGKDSGNFEVVNGGVYALNSSRLADLLPGWLEEYKPDLIVVMTGCNNAWNYRNSHLEALGLLEEDERNPLLKTLDNFRTYRFLRVLLKRQETGFGIAEEQAAPTPVLRDGMKISERISPAVDPTARTLERQRTIFKDTNALNKLLEHDQKEISRIAGEFGASTVLMSYPFVPPYQDHLEVTRRLAEERGLLFVDNNAAFATVKRRKPGLDLFSADRGHPNATGYRVIAAGVYDAMRAKQEQLGIALGPSPDPLASFKDRDYLIGIYEEVKEAVDRPGADEYSFEVLGHVAMELEDDTLAEEAFTIAFERSGGAPQFYESLGYLYVRQKKWDKLDELKEKMIAMRGDRNDISFLMEMFEREAAEGRQGPSQGELGGASNRESLTEAKENRPVDSGMQPLGGAKNVQSKDRRPAPPPGNDPNRPPPPGQEPGSGIP